MSEPFLGSLLLEEEKRKERKPESKHHNAHLSNELSVQSAELFQLGRGLLCIAWLRLSSLRIVNLARLLRTEFGRVQVIP
jgi:hypothetical protein